jgi:replicative DNA helicase loader DnaI
VSLKNFQYDALMRSYNQKQLLHKHEQSERIAQAEEKCPDWQKSARKLQLLDF